MQINQINKTKVEQDKKQETQQKNIEETIEDINEKQKQKNEIKQQQKKTIKNKRIINKQKKNEMYEQMIKQNKKGGDKKKKKYYQDLLKPHKYWDQQPTLRDDMDQSQSGNIQGERDIKQVRQNPIELPEVGLYFCEIDVKDQKELDQLYQLLTNNYVEDDDNTFRFDYSRQFLRWSLTPPGYQLKWLVGIRNKDKILISSITGVPVYTFIEENKIKMAEINYLCVHKQYRQKRLAPFLISQVTRRINLRNKWQAIYTSGKTLPTPFTRATYYHRSLNPKKLIDIHFSALAPHQTLAMVKKLYNLPIQPTLQNLRPMNKKDIYSVTELINTGLNKFVVKFHYTEQQIKHYFLPQQKIIYTYVLQKVQKLNGKKKIIITDLISFYSLPSHVMNHPKHKMLYACYSFFNFATSVSYVQLIKNALILSKINGFDVYNCLNLMDNSTVFQDLHFQIGDGNLNYYIYNWIMKCKKIKPQQLGVVLF